MENKDQILEQLTLAEQHIANAKVLVNEGPTPPPEFVPVNPGDNIMQLIADNPDNTLFQVHNDFVQNIGEATLPKPCTLKSERARLLCILSTKPDTHFLGMILEGSDTRTILKGEDRVTVDACSLIGNANGQHRGISANCKGMRIRNSRILNIFKDQDTQAVGGWEGTDDLEIIGNELEASGENIMFGGSDSSSESARPRNIRIENNHMFKKLEWRADPRASCKNLLELKDCENVVIKSNLLEYSFVDGQIGYGIVFSVRNQDGNAPWACIRNVVFEDNIVRHVAGGISILGRDDIFSSQVMDNVLIKNNRFEDINSAFGGNGREIFISGGPKNLTFDGNGFECPTMPNGIYFDQPQYQCENLVFRNQNLIVEGRYGIFGTNAGGLGKIVLDMYAPGYVWENNKVKKSGVRNISWPTGTIFV